MAVCLDGLAVYVQFVVGVFVGIVVAAAPLVLLLAARLSSCLDVIECKNSTGHQEKCKIRETGTLFFAWARHSTSEWSFQSLARHWYVPSFMGVSRASLGGHQLWHTLIIETYRTHAAFKLTHCDLYLVVNTHTLFFTHKQNIIYTQLNNKGCTKKRWTLPHSTITLSLAVAAIVLRIRRILGVARE